MARPTDRTPTVPGPGGLSLSPGNWLSIGIFGAVVLGGIAILLLPVGPVAHVLDPVPQRATVGIVLSVVAGCVMGLGLSQWYDWRPGGPAWKGRPPTLRPGTTGIRSAGSFEIYTPDTVARRRGRR